MMCLQKSIFDASEGNFVKELLAGLAASAAMFSPASAINDRLAFSRTATACSRLTDGNCLRKTSIESPSSR
jgi:hypothetical protein